METIVRMTCPKGHRKDYTVEDLCHVTDRDGVVDEAWVICKKCGVHFGEAEELNLLIEDLPDYEPDPDIEYDRMVEQALIEKELKK